MTVSEFNEFIKGDKPLVIIDNMVLNLGSFASVHPGGRLALQRTIGWDISKYFYGSYPLVSEKETIPAHLHSYTALQIAKRMIVAKLVGQERN